MKLQSKCAIGAAFFGSILFAVTANAGDEVCVVNVTDTPVEAGGPGSDKATIANNTSNAFCIGVNLGNDGPTVKGGMAVWARGPGDTYVEVNIEDPLVGELDFTSNGEPFNGAPIGGGLNMSAAQKGDDGVYRLFIR